MSNSSDQWPFGALIRNSDAWDYSGLVWKYLSVYNHYFSTKNKFSIPEIINICINMFTRLVDCRNMTNFLYAIVSFIKDMQGITYTEFNLKYEGFVMYSLLSIFAIKLIRKQKKVDNKKFDSFMKERGCTIPFSECEGCMYEYECEPSQAQDSASQAKTFLESVRHCLQNYTKVKDSEFGIKFSNLCAMIICSPFCVKAGIDSTWFGFSDIFHRRLIAKRENVEHFDLAFEVIDTTTYLLDKLILFAETKSYHFIYLDDNEVIEYEKSFEKLSHYSDKFSLLANQGMTIRDYLNECDITIERGKKLRDFYAADRFKSVALKSQQASLGKFKLRAYDKLQVNSKRDAPIAFCLFGPPGIGKSALIDKILHGLYLNDIALGATLKKYHPDMKYIFNEDDEFMSEFKASHEICVMDDVDQFSDKIMEAKEGGSIAKSIYFINPVPYVTAQAALEDKGMIPFLCRYVVMTTNTYDAGISKVFRKEGGAYRRFVFIEVKVKPEYRKNGQTQLDGDFSENGYMNHEMHEFWVRKYLSNANTSTPVYWDKESKTWSSGGEDSKFGLSLAELLKFYKDEIQTPHYRQTDLTKKSLDHFFASELCSVCDVSTAVCNCSKAQSGEDLAVDLANYAYEQSGNLYTLYIGCIVCFWYIVHKFFMLFNNYRPNFATHRLIRNIELLPSNYQPPCIISYIPRSIRAYFICDYWIEFFLHYSRIMNKGGILTMSMRNNMSHYYNKYALGSLIACIGAVMFFYKAFRSASYAQDGDVPYVDPEEKKKVNVWKTSFQPITKMVGAPSTTTLSQLVHVATFNCAKLYVADKHTCIFFIQSSRALVPKHFYDGFKDFFPVSARVIFDTEDNNVSMNRTLIITESNFIHTDLRDVIIFQHNSIVPRRDLSKFLLDKPIEGKNRGIIVARDHDGSVRPVPFEGLSAGYVHYYWRTTLISLFDQGYVAWTKSTTLPGDCGAPYIVQTPSGCFIAGIHIAGRDDNKMGMYRVECHRVLRGNLEVKNSMFLPTVRDGLDLKDTYNTDKDVSISQSVHIRDPIRLMSGTAAVYGTMEAYPRRHLKTMVDRTVFSEDVLSHYNLKDYTHFSPKTISTRAATVINVAPMLDKPSFPQDDVNRAEEALYTWYLRVINDHARPFPKGPFNIDVGINGYDGVLYVDRVPTKTSVGFPHGGPKTNHLIDLEPIEGHSVRRGFDDVLTSEYERMLFHYREGKRPAIVFDSNFKDEPISQSKIDKNKCRIFNAGPCAFTVLFRQYFLWCIPYFSGPRRHEFAMAIGANAYSVDWKVLYEHVTRHGVDRVIAGDYSNFDKRMSAQLMTAAFNVLIRICVDKGWNQEDILIMRGLATDVSYPLTNIFGLLIETDGSNPSGHPLTTVINGMCNIMYMMLACMDIERNLNTYKINYSNFLDYFSLLTYGDDNFGSSSIDVPYITHTNISRALSKYNVIYTMADKNSESRPHIHVSEADFLKRKFVLDSHFPGHVAAPLNEDSIIKMLTTIVVSNSITLQEQSAAVIESACREYFQYGRDIYNVKRQWFLELLSKYALTPYLSAPLLTWDERMVELYDDYGISQAQSYYKPNLRKRTCDKLWHAKRIMLNYERSFSNWYNDLPTSRFMYDNLEWFDVCYFDECILCNSNFKRELLLHVNHHVLMKWVNGPLHELKMINLCSEPSIAQSYEPTIDCSTISFVVDWFLYFVHISLYYYRIKGFVLLFPSELIPAPGDYRKDWLFSITMGLMLGFIFGIEAVVFGLVFVLIT